MFTTSAVKPQHVLFANESFLCKMLVSLFSSNILLNIEKNPVEKLCDVLEMELKMYIAVGLKFVFEKIKFKAFHYILRDFLRQRPGFSKDYTSIFKRIWKGIWFIRSSAPGAHEIFTSLNLIQYNLKEDSTSLIKIV